MISVNKIIEESTSQGVEFADNIAINLELTKKYRSRRRSYQPAGLHKFTNSHDALSAAAGASWLPFCQGRHNPYRVRGRRAGDPEQDIGLISTRPYIKEAARDCWGFLSYELLRSTAEE
jgi:hypothetical protein